MKKHLLSAGLLGLLGPSLTLPALARPEIASGDQLLDTDVSGCLALADEFITNLGVESDQGEIDRTGYFEDGSFRILCYGAGDASMAIVFASHETSVDIATNFIQMALGELAQGADTALSIPQPEITADSDS
jgi:hypothetical protein